MDDLTECVTKSLEMVTTSVLGIHLGQVERRPGSEETRFMLLSGATGLPVELGYSHDVHLWLEVCGAWRADAVASDLNDLLDEWRDMVDLGLRIATGLEAPPSATGEIWHASNGISLRWLRGK